MNIKEFENELCKHTYDLWVKTVLTNDGFMIRVVDQDNNRLADIGKYDPMSLNLNTRWFDKAHLALNNHIFIRPVVEFALTNIDEREYGPEITEPRYLVKIENGPSRHYMGKFLVPKGDEIGLHESFTFSHSANRNSMWSESNLAYFMSIMPDFDWESHVLDMRATEVNSNEV